MFHFHQNKKNILWNRFKITALEINILWNIFGIAYWYQIYDKINISCTFSFFNWFLVQVWSFPLINFNFSNLFLFIICIFLSSNTRSQRVDRSNSWNKMHKVLYFMLTTVVRLQGQIIWWSNLYIYIWWTRKESHILYTVCHKAVYEDKTQWAIIKEVLSDF